MLKIHTGNRMELLVDALARAVAEPLPDPFEPEVVVVQNRGMERWVTMELARRAGVWMNARFPFPNAAVEELFDRVLGPEEGAAGWARENLAWRVYALLPRLLERPPFGPLGRYLEGDPTALKRYQLALRIADLFDRYTVYRPEMVLDWEQGGRSGGEHGAWQAELWRTLVERYGPGHRAGRWRRFLDRVRRERPPGLPARLHVFGVSTLPRFHLEVLAAVARWIPVNLFVLNPCQEYWGDIVPDRVISRRERLERSAEHLEQGHRLLASLGRTGREFLDALVDLEAPEDALFEDPGGDRLLHRLQQDMLHLRDRGGPAHPPLAVDPADRSVVVASCHSPLREVEALRDHLLALFQALPDLEPHQIVVMTPDIEAYAPLVEAVFRPEGGDVPAIPYNVADRNVLAGSALVDAFFRVLDLAGSRFGAARVVDLLETPAVARRFGLSEADLERIRGWVRRAGIRWGLDAEHRRRLGLPAFPENTWRAGLDRLLLGYALPGDGERLFQGVLPFDDVEGAEDGAALGRLVEFVGRLEEAAGFLAGEHPLEAWARKLAALFDALFLPEPEEEREARVLRAALDDLARADPDGAPVPLAPVRAHLRGVLERAAYGGGFLTGGVTFCAMLPMRSIPFRVVCLLGLNDGAFPRPDRPAGFDLMAREPRRGDRSVRDEDRYVFLEALVSAREHLYVSYVGQSQRDGADIPPSVLVSELLETLDRGYRFADRPDRPVSERLVVRHRLQAFSPAYFRPGGGLTSFSEENLQACRVLLGRDPSGDPAPWLPGPLPEPPEELRNVSLENLVRFLENPARGLLRMRYGLRLGAPAEPVEEDEPLELDRLGAFRIQEELLRWASEGRDLRGTLPVFRARGDLPPGQAGRAAFAEASEALEPLREVLEPFLAQPVLEPVPFELDLGEARLTGTLRGLRPCGLVFFRPGAIRGKDRVRAWLHHLVLCAAGPDGAEPVTVQLGFDRRGVLRLVLEPVEAARGHLAGVLRLYLEGLRQPVPFFPETSWTYAQERWERGKAHEKALAAARRAWEGRPDKPGEAAEPHVMRCFGDADPLASGGFERAAWTVFRPFLAARLNPKER